MRWNKTLRERVRNITAEHREIRMGQLIEMIYDRYGIYYRPRELSYALRIDAQFRFIRNLDHNRDSLYRRETQ